MQTTTIATIIIVILALPILIGMMLGAISTMGYLLGKVPSFINKQIFPRVCYCFLPVYLFIITFIFYLPACILSLIFNPMKKVSEAIGRMYKLSELVITHEWKEANNLPRNAICTYWEDAHGITAKQYIKMITKNNDDDEEGKAKLQSAMNAFHITGVAYIALIIISAYFTF